jgi:hypothetical protein
MDHKPLWWIRRYGDINEVIVRLLTFNLGTINHHATFGVINLLYQLMCKGMVVKAVGGGMCAKGSMVSGCGPIGTLSVGFSI